MGKSIRIRDWPRLNLDDFGKEALPADPEDEKRIIYHMGRKTHITPSTEKMLRRNTWTSY